MIRNFFNKYNLMLLFVGLFYHTMGNNAARSNALLHDVAKSCESKHQIAPDVFFAQHSDPFAEYVLNLQSRLASRSTWVGEKFIISGARLWEGCDDDAITCMQISYGFFDRDSTDIKALCCTVDLDVVNTILKEYYKKPGDMNWLSHVSYVAHIDKINLPSNINKDDLKGDPKKYKKIIAEKKVNPNERDKLIASGLCARYWVRRVFSGLPK